MPELGHAHGVEADLVAEERHGAVGPIAAQTSALTAAKESRTTASAACARHAPSVDEPDLEPGALELGRDLRPGAVDDADLVPLRQRERERRRLSRDRTADLEHDPAHVR